MLLDPQAAWLQKEHEHSPNGQEMSEKTASMGRCGGRHWRISCFALIVPESLERGIIVVEEEFGVMSAVGDGAVDGYRRWVRQNLMIKAEVNMLLADRFNYLTWMLLIAVVGQAAPAAAQRSRSEPGEKVSFRTKDGMELKATYYASELGKEAVPIVMLHDFKESRTVFNGLAEMLQSPPEGSGPSHAVLTVDLRGHGQSTTQHGRNGATRELEAARLGKQDFRNMVLYDMEAVRKFLVKQNDAGQLNLNKLCLLGSGLGANVATSWSSVDWSAPKLANLKQGQDVKALVMSSPDWNYTGLPMLKPLRHRAVREKISMLIIYGKDDRKANKSAETINKNLERYHPEPPPSAGPEEKDLVLLGLPTSLEGTRLLTDPSFRILPKLSFFLEARLSKQDYAWERRSLRD